MDWRDRIRANLMAPNAMWVETVYLRNEDKLISRRAWVRRQRDNKLGVSWVKGYAKRKSRPGGLWGQSRGTVTGHRI